MNYENPWRYNGHDFSSSDIGDSVGFVYIITDPDGKKYVGKKNFFSKRKLPPLKGKTRRRTKIIESDWREYYGSSETVKQLVEETQAKGFKREILHLCKTKGEMSYLEMVEQVERKVLFKPDEYHNSIIQVRIHRNHVLDKMKIK